MAKWVYLFEEGSADMKNLLGGERRESGGNDKDLR